MEEVPRLLILLALAGAALTLVGGAAIWYRDEARQVRRGLRKVLKVDPHALLVAAGRGRGVGFNFTTNLLAVAWDAGAWCLIYRVDELIGAEMVVDGQVVARTYRGEERRPLDLVSGAEALVRLRLIFTDPAHPDFALDLWLPQDADRRGAWTAAEAMQEANRWMARIEALMRQRAARRDAPVLTRTVERAPELAAEDADFDEDPKRAVS